MSVRYSKSRKLWFADFTDALGVRRTPSFQTRAEAATAEHKGASGRRRNTGVDPGVTFGALYREWIDEVRLRVRPQTADGYSDVMRDHFLPTLENVPMVDVNRQMIRELLLEKSRGGYKRSTIGRFLVTLSGLFSYAVERQLFESSPIHGLGRKLGIATGNPAQRSKIEKVKALRAVELKALLTQLRDHHDRRAYVASCLMAWAGLRVGEAVALKWADVENDQIRVERTAVRMYGINPTKGGAGQVPCSERLSAVLAEYRKTVEGAWLFPEMSDPRPSVISRIMIVIEHGVRDAAKKIGVYASPHCLRHSFATIQLAAGVPPQKIQAWLRHKDIGTTIGTYGSWFPHEDVGGHLTGLSDATAPSETSAPEVQLPTGPARPTRFDLDGRPVRTVDVGVEILTTDSPQLPLSARN